MSDELSIQQQNQGSKTPYVLTGGVVGAAGAGFPTWYFTKPKYGSYEEIVNEASKADEFQKKIDAAEGEEKTFFEEAKKVADAKAEAEKKYNEELNAYIEEHTKEKAAELDPNSTEAKNLKTAEDALAAKKQSALNDEIARITKEENAKTVDEKAREALKKQEEQINRATQARINKNNEAYNKINEYIANTAATEDVAVQDELKEYAKKVKELNSYEKMLEDPKKINGVKDIEIVTDIDKKGIKINRPIQLSKDISEADRKNALEYIKKAKETAVKVHDYNLKTFNGGMFNIKGLSAEERHSLAEQVAAALEDTRALNENKEALTNGIKKKVGELETVERDVLSAYEERLANEPKIRRRINGKFAKSISSETQQFVDAADKNKIADLTKDIDRLKFAQTVQKLNGYSIQEGTTIVQGKGNAGDLIDKIIKGDFNFEAASVQSKLSLAEQEEVKQLQAQLQEQVAKVKEDIKANFTKDGKKAVPTEAEVNAKFLEAIRSAEGEKSVVTRIATLEGELNPIKEALTRRQELSAKWRNLHLELESVLGKGYQLEKDAAGNVTRILMADGKEFTSKSALKFTGKIATPVVEQTEEDLRRLLDIKAKLNNVERLTPEQIKAKAQEIVDKKVFKAEQDAVNAAKTAAEEAKAKLPKVEVMTKEAATEAFHKAKDVTGKEAFVDNEVKSKVEEFIEKYSKELEGKLGKNAGWKLAGIAAAGAIVCGLIGSALAPKKAQ